MHEKITVTVDDAHVGDVDSVADGLRAAGMEVSEVLGPVGIILGSVASEQRGALESLPGVMAVESEQAFQLPPPDAEIQ